MNTFLSTDLKCQKCGAEFLLPDLPDDIKGNVSTIAREVGRVNAVLELKNQTNVGLGDAKAIAFHLSKGDTCHRCDTQLKRETGVQDCPKCRSLNLRW
jgi:Zn finger protein HypA/HybF involved in hydrogenase expression